MSWKKYQRIGTIELRLYVEGEPLDGIGVSDVDDPEKDMGFIARNPDNHKDQWYVAKDYVAKNYIETPDAK